MDNIVIEDVKSDSEVEEILSGLVDPDDPNRTPEPKRKHLTAEMLEALTCSAALQSETFAREIKPYFHTGCVVVTARKTAMRTLWEKSEQFNSHPSKNVVLGFCEQEFANKIDGVPSFDLVEALYDSIVPPSDFPFLAQYARECSRKTGYMAAFLELEKKTGIDYEKIKTTISETESKLNGKCRRAMGLDEMFSMPPPQWQIDDHIFQGSTVCVYGSSGKGKTFYALDMALSVATGKMFLDTYPVVKGPVAYIISEGQNSFQLRCQAWLKYHNISETPKNFAGLPYTFNLCDVSEADEVVQGAREFLGCDPAMIFTDTLARNFEGDENATKDMNKFVRVSDYMRAKTKATMVIVHHAGWGETKRERGSSALRGAMDTSIEISMTGEGSESRITVHCEKQKDKGAFKDYCLNPTVVPLVGKLDSLVWSIQSDVESREESEIENQIFGMLTEYPSGGANEKNVLYCADIATSLDKDPKYVQKRLNRMVEAKRIKSGTFKKGGRGKPPSGYWRETVDWLEELKGHRLN